MKEELIIVRKNNNIFKFRHEFSTNQLFYQDDGGDEIFIGFWIVNKSKGWEINWNKQEGTKKIKELYEKDGGEEESNEEDEEKDKLKEKKGGGEIQRLKELLGGYGRDLDFSDKINVMSGGGNRINNKFRGYGFTFF